MFAITAAVKIEGFKAVPPSALEWNIAVDNICDSAKVKLPALAIVQSAQGLSLQQTGNALKEGLKIEIYAGYDNQNDLHFSGFIKRVNFSTPAELECEGYSYLLRKKIGINKNYKNSTAKKILQDLVSGTPIKLHKDIPNIPLDKAVFKNASGMDVLEWLKNKCLLAVYFQRDVLYCGGLMLAPSSSVKYRLGWNTAKDDDLRFGQRQAYDVKITVAGHKDYSGARQKQSAAPRIKAAGEKKLTTSVRDPSAQKAIAQREHDRLATEGYEGSVTGFLKPFVFPGMTCFIGDKKYPARTGRYFVNGVEGSVSTGGGRIKVKLGHKLSA